ncbi:E2 [Macaca fascicularis papillomavirus 2]|uniref:Regulatory protein E2 n=1 Tax=Macaca fascicularis papillomavirus 2 TaxID=915424 RepID=F8QPP7_9PAPI|nr:E2 [Macaca fascicularis papillomavirus 2]ADQ39302.1 E2 [Macaca fascicularis papillomavirus 2]
METLSERFHALQEKLMEIYESGKNTIAAQIEHWQLLRQEQVLLHFARKRGVTRLGYQPVPNLAITEQKAKDAIGMGLLLQSLEKSPYGGESWSLVDTSLETFRSPPQQCFKKGGQEVEVRFDGDPENIMLYTSWQHIYFQDSHDSWQKVQGQVDYDGLFYFDGPVKVYYVTFGTDAKRYGKTGLWEVVYNKDIIFAPVTSSTPEGQGSPAPADSNTAEGSQHPTEVVSVDSATTSAPAATSATAKQRARRYGRKASSPGGGERGYSPLKENQRERRPHKRGRGERGGRSRSRSRATSRSRSRSRSRTRTRARPQSATTTHPCTRSRSRSRPGCVLSGGGGVLPSQVGSRLSTVGQGHQGRLGQLLAEATDPPVILLRGDPNAVKCFRFRAKDKYRGLYTRMSTTWSWVGADNNDRIGRARMLVAFSSYEQRHLFLKHLKVPKGMDWSLGQFDSL